MDSDHESQSKDVTSRNVSPEESEALDKVLDLLDIAASADDRSPAIAPELRKIINGAKRRLHEDAKDNGFKAQARRQIDEHRREAGREPYNDKRRREYADKVFTESGAFPRAYMKGMPPEHRKAQVKAAKARHLANRAPEQVAEDKRKKAEQERARRIRKKEEARPQHFGKF